LIEVGNDFSNQFEYGVYVNDGYNNTVQYTTINISTANSSHGIFFREIGSNNTAFSNIINIGQSNCSLSHGIQIYSNDYTNISENVIQTNGSQCYGIEYKQSNYSSFSYNNITTLGDNAYGIHLQTFSDFNQVFGNHFIVNNHAVIGSTSINLEGGNIYNNITNNLVDIYDWSNTGIQTDCGSDFNNIVGNIINGYAYNSKGVFLFTSSFCTAGFHYGTTRNNVLYNNITLYGDASFGVQLWNNNQTFHNITGNRIIAYNGTGIKLENGSNNNFFSSNFIQTYQSGRYPISFNSSNNNLFYDSNLLVSFNSISYYFF
jgi:hypothetical protein